MAKTGFLVVAGGFLLAALKPLGEDIRAVGRGFVKAYQADQEKGEREFQKHNQVQIKGDEMIIITIEKIPEQLDFWPPLVVLRCGKSFPGKDPRLVKAEAFGKVVWKDKMGTIHTKRFSAHFVPDKDTITPGDKIAHQNLEWSRRRNFKEVLKAEFRGISYVHWGAKGQ